MLNGAPARAPGLRPTRRRAPRRGLTIRWTPDVVIAFFTILGLTLLPLLGSKGALMFLMGGMILMVTGPDRVFRAARREWLLIAMATWCLVSFAWSDYAGVSLRYGIQLMLTILISLTICQRIGPQALVKIVLLTHFIAGILSLASGNTREDGLGYLGIYGSKNALAFAMGLLFLVGLAVLLDSRMSWRWRLLALIGAALGATLMVMGQSTGALAAVAVSVAAVGPLMLLRRMQAPTRLVVIVLSIVLAAAVGVMITTIMDEIALQFLNATGKDMTLTGRTELWGIAIGEIMERPLRGVGFQAFWVLGNPLAEELWAIFGIEARSGFNFHSTLISNAVEIGLIGVTLQAVLFFTAVYFVLSWAMQARSAASLFLAVLMVRQLILMWVEVVYFFQFDIATVLVVAALYYGRSFRLAAQTSRPAPQVRAQVLRPA